MWTGREGKLDPRVLTGVMHTLRYAASVDVRLAALDALSRHAGQPQVKKTVVDALQEQQSPLMQVALIDQLVEGRGEVGGPPPGEQGESDNLNAAGRERRG